MPRVLKCYIKLYLSINANFELYITHFFNFLIFLKFNFMNDISHNIPTESNSNLKQVLHCT